jgi:ribosomal protein S18 acetylase RimI-like enzyme
VGVLDNPVWSALTGPQTMFAEVKGRARRYPADVSLFAALPDRVDDEVWRDLLDLSGLATELLLAGYDGPVPDGWAEPFRIDGYQLVAGDALSGTPDPEAVELGADDVPAMLELVERTHPGPFGPGTYRLGSYLGIKRAGRLVAMTGERMRLAGYTEISAVCTDPEHRGQGLALRLIRAVAAGIRARGEVPFLHVAAGNTAAIRLYQSLGFAQRREISFRLLRTPEAPR